MGILAAARGFFGVLEYVNLFVDLDRRRLMFGRQGRDAKAFRAFRLDLMEHGGQPEPIRGPRQRRSEKERLSVPS